MIKRTLHFGNPAYLSLQNKQLLISFPENELQIPSRSVPIEDVGIIMLSHKQITITQACMGALLDNKAVIITCGDNHLPTGMMLPFEGHTTQSLQYKHQILASQPLKKNLWAQTVKAKILNQAAVLKDRRVPYDNMLYWAKSVKAGDPDNYEARAAAYYWKTVFPEKVRFFRNREGNPPNNLLNYGYAILRAIIARALVCSGLLPTLGIFHKSKYNAYCLADDLMEPYRPYVDKIVLEIIDDGENFLELTTSIKARLLNIASTDVSFTKGRSPLLVGAQTTTSSLAKCYNGTLRKLQFPQMCQFNGRMLLELSADYLSPMPENAEQPYTDV